MKAVEYAVQKKASNGDWRSCSGCLYEDLSLARKEMSEIMSAYPGSSMRIVERKVDCGEWDVLNGEHADVHQENPLDKDPFVVFVPKTFKGIVYITRNSRLQAITRYDDMMTSTPVHLRNDEDIVCPTLLTREEMKMISEVSNQTVFDDNAEEPCLIHLVEWTLQTASSVCDEVNRKLGITLH